MKKTLTSLVNINGIFMSALGISGAKINITPSMQQKADTKVTEIM